MRTSADRGRINPISLLVLLALAAVTLGGCSSPPLANAAGKADTATLTRLLEAGGDINARDGNGYTALHWAACNGQLESARLLVEHGANIEATDNSSLTPLEVAICYNQSSIAKLLLEKGANVNAHDENGWTPVDYAANNTSKYSIYNLDPAMLSMVITYLEHSPSEHINDHGVNGYTPLHWAACNGHLLAVKDLLERNANIEATESGGLTPLLVAAYGAQDDVAKYLVEKGANVNVQDAINWTALDYAACNRDLPMVKMLVEHGANVDVNAKGISPLKIARKYGATAVVEFLKANSAKE